MNQTISLASASTRGGAFGEDQRVRSKISGKRFASGHATMESHRSPSASQKYHPTDVGRHVSCGCLQSMPDSRCADEIVTTPSAGDGHRKRPRSKRFREQARTLAVVPDHLQCCSPRTIGHGQGLP
jgi:hypothetical protein